MAARDPNGHLGHLMARRFKRQASERVSRLNSRPKILYLVTEDWYFWSHRLPIAEAAQRDGFEVVVACRVGKHADRIKERGFRPYPLRWRRDRNSILDVCRSLFEVVRLYRLERPDIVHHVALKPVVLGGVAAVLIGRSHVISALAGLGYVFTSRSLKARLVRWPIGLLLRLLLTQRKSRIILQNNDDRDYLVRLCRVREERVAVIRGSGVDLDQFKVIPEPPDACVTIAYVGRMIEIKGVRVLVAAFRLLRSQLDNVRLLLVGSPDLGNPEFIAEADLTAWANEPGIDWIAHSEDVCNIWSESHIAVQPSLGGEGLPKSLLEAAACGRPIVATDVPGCREIARPKYNALLVPPNDPAALADALAQMVRDPALRRQYGENSWLVATEMSSHLVAADTMKLYRDLIGSDPVEPRDLPVQET